MGFVSDAELRRAPAASGEPEPVGSFWGHFRGRGVSATLVTWLNGKWEFGGEIAIEVAPNNMQELPGTGNETLYWYGMEVTAKTGDLPRAGGGYLTQSNRYFVVASLASPEGQSLGWATYAPLRRVLNRTAEERSRLMRASLDKGRLLRDLKWDPFLQDKGRYAARLDDPITLHYANGRNLGNGFVAGTEGFGITTAVWRFGICPEACLQAHGIEWHAQVRTQPVLQPGAVRLPRVESANRKALHALAGRSGELDEMDLATALAGGAA